MEIDIIDLGYMEYEKALEIQMNQWEKVHKEEGRDTLYLVEHPPVITLGVRGKTDNILLSCEELQKLGVSIHKINRGGDVTYHGNPDKLWAIL